MHIPYASIDNTVLIVVFYLYVQFRIRSFCIVYTSYSKIRLILIHSIKSSRDLAGSVAWDGSKMSPKGLAILISALYG